MSKTEHPIDDARARELLHRERERIEAALADLKRTRRGELDEIDSESVPADKGESIEEGQVDSAVADQLRTELAAVERAEKRLADGAFGFSVESGEPIPVERLEAVPWAERTSQEQQRHGPGG